jgi:hypothetical protein
LRKIQGFGFAVVEWFALFCLVSGKNTEHELQQIKQDKP